MDEPRKTTSDRPGRRVRADKPHDAAKRKLNLVLSADAAQRLGVHALMTGTERSAIVEGWIVAHCRRFVVQDRGGPGLVKPDDHVNRVAETPTTGQDMPAVECQDAPEGEGPPPTPPRRRRGAQAADGG